MKYAVIEAGGKQYVVKVGDVIEVEKIKSNEKEVTLDNVLLTVDDSKVNLGTPFIKNASIKAQALEPKKGEKINILRYKSKSRYRRKVGHRKHLTQLKISSIDTKTSREKNAKS